MRRHGFARDREFSWTERRNDSCTLVLEDDAETRRHYPFAFRFELRYGVSDTTLDVRFRVGNTGSEVLPVSVGAHPAFRWPLAAGIAKEAHTLEFSDDEPSAIRRLQDGLLQPRDYPTPIDGRTLRLSESLFVDDAMILERPRSRSVRFTAPGAPVVDVSWDRFRELGLWSKTDAAFLCIEPWYGYASPLGFAGDFDTKPGLLHIVPGRTETLSMQIRVT